MDLLMHTVNHSLNILSSLLKLKSTVNIILI